MLTNKGLLSFLEENRLNLASPFPYTGSQEKTQELVALGLIFHANQIGSDIYGITEAGRVFLNKLEAQKLVSPAGDP